MGSTWAHFGAHKGPGNPMCAEGSSISDEAARRRWRGCATGREHSEVDPMVLGVHLVILRLFLAFFWVVMIPLKTIG